MMIDPFTFSPLLLTSHGGFDQLLSRRRKTSFGARKNKPSRKYSALTNHVEPYTAPNTMKREFNVEEAR